MGTASELSATPPARMEAHGHAPLAAAEMANAAPSLSNAQVIPHILEEQPGFQVPNSIVEEVKRLLTHYPQKRSASLMVLHALQEHFGFVSRQAVEWTAVQLDLQPINVYELVTFYPMFQRRKVGQKHIRICRTLSCALAGSYKLHEFFCEKLGFDPEAHGPQTTADGRYTVEFVECLAGCDKAPVVMVNDVFHENMDSRGAEAVLKP